MEDQMSIPHKRQKNVKPKNSADAMGGNADCQAKTEVHPMKNPVVLARLFQLCPEKLLAKFRLVSKEWYQLAIKSWRSTVIMTFVLNDPTTQVPFYWKPANTTTTSTPLQDFYDYVKEPTHEHLAQPFRNFKLDGWKFGISDKRIIQFAKVCGPYITVVELVRCTFSDPSVFRDVLFKWFPNLQKLVLTDASFENVSARPIEPEKFMEPEHGAHKKLKILHVHLSYKKLAISWMELFTHFPCLEDFKLFNASDNGDDYYVQQALNAIRIIRNQDKQKLNLKKLDLLRTSFFGKQTIAPELRLLLHNAQLQLESLTIDLSMDSDTEPAREILGWHAATLTKLKVYRHPSSKFSFRNFPFGCPLNNLEELGMNNRVTDALTFITYTPNLKKLHILPCLDEDEPPSYLPIQVFTNSNSQIMRDVKLQKCTELRFKYVISIEETRVLITSLPNIEKVQMPMNSDQFRLVCKLWSNLRDLEVLGLPMGDEVITGLKPEDITAINTAEDSRCSPLVKPVGIHPNITNLEKLERFKMVDHVDENSDMPPILMDCSAYFGFLKLQYLQTLIVLSAMNDPARSDLLAKIPECILDHGLETVYDSNSD